MAEYALIPEPKVLVPLEVIDAVLTALADGQKHMALPARRRKLESARLSLAAVVAGEKAS